MWCAASFTKQAYGIHGGSDWPAAVYYGANIGLSGSFNCSSELGKCCNSTMQHWDALVMGASVDILPDLKNGDTLYRTAMSGCKNVLGRVHMAVVSNTTLTANPFSYSETCSTLRAVVRDGPTARISAG